MIDATPSHAVLREFFDNSALTWGLMACGVAQLSKLFLELLLHRRWRPAVLIETGGMPSSHSALVTGTGPVWAGPWALITPSSPLRRWWRSSSCTTPVAFVAPPG